MPQAKSHAIADPLKREFEFTSAYRRHQSDPVALREAHCLKIARTYGELREGDLFAGRHLKVEHDPAGQLIGFGLEHEDSGQAYYCDSERVRQRLDASGLNGSYRRRAEAMLDFWREHATMNKNIRNRSDETRAALSTEIASAGLRLAGVLLNFDKLTRVGYCGLRKEIRLRQALAARSGGDVAFYKGALMALDVFAGVCRTYAAQARAQAEAQARARRNAERRKELLRIAEVLDRILVAKPATFREAAQLAWLYAVVTGVTNYGRMDVYLGDFLARDLDSGALSQAEALRLTQSLWQLIAAARYHFNSRVIIGGRGRRNETNADRFALIAIEASRTVHATEPQLSLRFYTGQNPALMQRALDAIGEGCTYPILYNDDINVAAAQQAFGVERGEAERYLPYGCGEYTLDHLAFGSPNSSFNLLAALLAALRNGRTGGGPRKSPPESLGWDGPPHALATNAFSRFKTFEQLLRAYKKQVEHYAHYLAVAHAIELKTEREDAAFLLPSLLYDGCLERGKSLVNGGVKYLGGISESMGLVNAADSLTAIKRLVYDDKRFTPAQLLAMLDANWEGYEKEHRMFLNAPKYGNDDAGADAMVREVSRHACQAIRDAGREAGLDYYLMVNINNHIHVGVGRTMPASPDGRKAGAPIANGGSPTAGYDKKGATAYLNSITAIEPQYHAGYVFNLKLGRALFQNGRAKLEALFNGYWARGGTQSMITVLSREDMEAAMREPEKHANLIVRVGGFSARFVELERDLQLDLIRRTYYE